MNLYKINIPKSDWNKIAIIQKHDVERVLKENEETKQMEGTRRSGRLIKERADTGSERCASPFRWSIYCSLRLISNCLSGRMAVKK